MEDCFWAFLATMLKHNCEFKDFWFNRLWKGSTLIRFLIGRGFLEKFSGQYPKNHICSDTLGKQLIEFSPDWSQLFGALFLNYCFRNVLSIDFILRSWYISFISEVFILQLCCLKHHNGSAEISLRKITNRLSKWPWKIKALPLADSSKYFYNFSSWGCRHSNLKASRSQRKNNFR